MNSKWQDELSDAKLREYAGATVFARGREYAHEGCAVLVRDGRTSTTWTVAGTHRYQVELDLEENELHANCTCPYAEEHGFCKHMVAAALSWRAHLGGAPLPLAASSAGAASAKSAERAAARAAKHDALQAFLLAQPAHDLARHLLSWAEQDRDLMAVLRAWQAEAKAGDTPGGWKEVLTTLLKNRQEFLDGGDCRRYAQRGMQAVALLQKLVDGHSAAALDAGVYALRQIAKVYEKADDSNGELGVLMEAIDNVMASALRAAPPTGDAAKRWLQTWFALQQETAWGFWNDQAMLAAAGPEVGALYSARVARDWAEWLQSGISSATPTQRVYGLQAIGPYGHFDLERGRLRQRLLDDLRRHGDGAGVLEVLRSSIEGPDEHLELARYLESLGRQRESLQQLETANRAFPGEQCIEDALLQAYQRDGCVDDVLAIRRRQLERLPQRITGYKAVLTAAAAAGRDPHSYRDELHAWAAQRETEHVGRNRASSPARDVSVRVLWLLHEQRPAEALALTRLPHATLSQAAWHDLARGLRVKSPADAAIIFARLLEYHMTQAQSPYREELELVREWLPVLTPAAARGRLEELKMKYRTKRNFVAGLGLLTIEPENGS